MPQSVQVVFQGGGAKLAALLPAAEAVRAYESGNRFVVSRVAGSSAGAIAACLFATREDIKVYRQKIIGLAPKFLPRLCLPTTKVTCAWKLLLGRALLDEDVLRDFLYELFAKDYEKFSSFRILVLVTAADIVNSEKKVFCDGNENVLTALLDSCAIPFCFRTHKAAHHFVDGGLCENLPADELVDEAAKEKYGDVIGFSFKRGKPIQPRTFIDYAKALLETAVDNSVQRAAKRIGAGKIFHIDTTLQTFQFDECIHELRKDSFWRYINLTATSWLDSVFAAAHSRGSQRIVLGSKTEPVSVEDLMAKILEVHELIVKPDAVKIERWATIVFGHSLKSDDAKVADEIRQVLEITPESAHVETFANGIGSGEVSPIEGLTEFWIDDKEGVEVNAVAVPVTHMSKESSAFDRKMHSIVFFFNPPLEPERAPYKLWQSNRQYDAISGLKTDKGVDHALLVSKQAREIAISDFIFAVPKNFPKIHMYQLEEHMQKQNRCIKGREMTSAELSYYKGYCPYDFRVFGWRAVGPVKKNEYFGVSFKKDTN